MPAVRRCATAAAALAALALAACGGGGGGASEAGGGSAAAGPQVALTLQRVFARLPAFSAPVALLQAPNDASRWFVVQQGGRVLVFPNDSMTAASAVFADISGRVAFRGEAGLLGMAFHPRFPADPRVVLFYSRDEPGVGLVSRLSEFSADAAGLSLDPASERVLVTIRKPEENHNGGGIAFGPDGFLYAGIGDGGGGNDQHGAIGNAQSATTLLGKMLRIDPRATADAAYTVPPDNPFVGVDGARGEIWSIGLRNPWRFSFDRTTGDLWIADVGQNQWEEVDVAWAADGGGRGLNFGWSAWEGSHPFNADQSPDGATPPIHEYEHGSDCSISGGALYRGTEIPALAGWYVFGDYCSGQVRALQIADRAVVKQHPLGRAANITAVREGPDGELFVLTRDGPIYALTPG